jgi:hypothetical protein
MKEVFSELDSGELQELEALLKRIGTRAQYLETRKLGMAEFH